MATHEQVSKLLVGFVLGELSEQESLDVKAHVTECKQCSQELKLLETPVKCADEMSKLSTDEPSCGAAIEAILSTVENEQKPVSRPSISLDHIWRIIMNNKMTKLAVAAMIIIAAGLFFIIMERTTTPVWADIIEPILNAKTAVFEIIVGDENSGALVIQDEIMGSRIRRTMAGIDAETIIDLEKLKILSLDHEQKQATFVDLKGLPKIPNYLEIIRKLLTEIQESPAFYTEPLDEQILDGRDVYGIRAFHPRVELTIWVDAETDLPTRVEQQEKQMKIICRNMQFDVPMDESMFSMDVPDGYKQHQQQIDLMGATEEHFLDYLRILTEVVYDGIFPEDISVEYYVKQVHFLKEKFDSLDMSDEQKNELGTKLAQGLLFIRFFKGQGKWYYRGSGVELGDGQAPVFWYHPKGSEIWRVIYGDLRAEDVAQQDLPEPPEQQSQESKVKYQQWLGSKSNYVVSQEDEWTVVSPEEIRVQSTLIIRKSPETYEDMVVQLTFQEATVRTVKLGDNDLTFSRGEPNEYHLDLSTLQDTTQSDTITILWTFSPVTYIRPSEMGRYRFPLKSLVPSDSFSLIVTIAEGSGFEFSFGDSENRTAHAFSGSSDKPKMDYGNWHGLTIQKNE